MVPPEMSVLEIISQPRETEPAFKNYDTPTGEYICCSTPFDTLQQVADMDHLDIEKQQQELAAFFINI